MKKLCAILFSLFIGLSASSALADIQLNTKNVISLRGPVNSDSVTEVSHKLLTSKEKELYLFIDSPGGSIVAGLQLVYILNNLPKDKEVTCISNYAASMAFIVTQACPTRVVLPHSVLMQHVASYGLRGDEPNNYSMANFIRRMVKKLVKMQAKRLGMKASTFYKKTRDDWWLYGDESVKYGAADRVEENVTCSAALSAKTEQISVRSAIWSVTLTFSACPLIRGNLKSKAEQIAGVPSLEANKELEDIMNWWNPQESMKILQSKKKLPSVRVLPMR